MATLSNALNDHAKQLKPIVGALATGILTELQPRGWKVYHFRSGANSWAIVRGGKQFHFRYYHNDEILVKDAYYHGKTVYEIKDEDDVKRFLIKVMKGRI